MAPGRIALYGPPVQLLSFLYIFYVKYVINNFITYHDKAIYLNKGYDREIWNHIHEGILSLMADLQKSFKFW